MIPSLVHAGYNWTGVAPANGSSVFCTTLPFDAYVTATAGDPALTSGTPTITLPQGYAGSVTLHYKYVLSGATGRFGPLDPPPPPPTAQAIFIPVPTAGTQFTITFTASVTNSGGTRSSTTNTTFTAK